MISRSTVPPLRVALFCPDSAERARKRSALNGLEVRELTDLSQLQQVCQAETTDVLVFCGAELPEVCGQGDGRAALVWVAPEDSVGPVDALLPPHVSDTEFRHCVELVGTRAVLMREIEQLAERVEEAFGRHKWRGGWLWRPTGELVQMAITDPLTGVFNRRYLDQALREECERCKSAGTSLSLLIIDLDRFKPVNDTWGHRVGDVLLCQVAGRLQRTTRRSDLVCRYGGDEFAVVAPGTDAQSAGLLAERLNAAISRTNFQTEGHEIRIGCSLGVASSLGNDSPTADVLLHRADLALLSAKRRGGETICHWSELREEA